MTKRSSQSGSPSSQKTEEALAALEALRVREAVQREPNVQRLAELSELIERCREGGAEVAQPSPARDDSRSEPINPHRPATRVATEATQTAITDVTGPYNKTDPSRGR